MTIKTPQNATTIDTISEGFAAVGRRPWLALLPLLLSAYLWFGPQISFGPLTTRFADALRDLQRDAASQPSAEQLDAMARALGQQDMRRLLVVFDFVPTLTLAAISTVNANGDPLAMPTPTDTAAQIDPQRAAVLEVTTAAGAALAFVLINAVALLLSALFLANLAEAVLRGQSPLAAQLQRSGRTALRLVGFFGVVWGIKLLLGLPFLFLTSLLLLIVPGLGALAMLVLLSVNVCVDFFIWFAPEAIVISEIGPLRAIYASFNIVRRNLWATLWLWLLLGVVSLGTSLIWASLVGSPAGLAAALIGSAFIGSGLLAARMAFYRERLRRWQAASPVRWAAQ